MLRALYDWTLRLAGHRRATWALGGVSFAESSFFPIPPDVLLIPTVLARRERAWFLAAVCTLTSVAGGLFGYLIGFALFETIGRAIIDLYGMQAQYGEFQGLYNEWGAWIVFAAGFTPIPYKVFTIASGATGLDLVVFTVASLLSRGGRFFLVAGLLRMFGAPIQSFIERNLGWLTVAFVAILAGGFAALKLL